MAVAVRLRSRTLFGSLSLRAVNNFNKISICYSRPSVVTNSLCKPRNSCFSLNTYSYRFCSSNSEKDLKENSGKTQSVVLEQPAGKPSQRARLKQAVRDYGVTIIVFHVGISLASLGISYLAIVNGVDATRVLTFLGFSESLLSNEAIVGGSTFVMAYALHKIFAPVRMAITLSAVPFIVRYLRKIKWLKPPKSKT